MLRNLLHRSLVGLLLLFVTFSRGGLPGADCQLPFQRGDSNRDDKVDLSDPIFTLGYLFLGAAEPGCMDAADADDSGKLDLSDAVFSVGFLFLGGAPIPPPVLDSCGVDPTEDALACLEYAPCGAAGNEPCTSNECCPLDSYCEKDVDSCDGAGVCVVRPEGCPRLFDPWCGCDGVTYGNRCLAAAAGVNVVSRGECLKPGGCLSNEECDPGNYCATQEGSCGSPGECRVIPDICIKIFDPVCGCDGITYANECLAGAAGVSVARRGDCNAGARCLTSEDCSEELFCSRKQGFCGEPGVCIADPAPTDCQNLPEAPVCGCDDMTYRTECDANLNGVSVAYMGACDGIPRCSSNADCAEDSYCEFPDGFCGGLGECAVRPLECAGEVLNPICGCDEKEYPSACAAAQAGVSVSTGQKCHAEPIDCQTNASCGEAFYCAKAEGDCDGRGTCETRPAACDANIDPVCGCDGITYTNACQAEAAGVNVVQQGECP